jgi:uncharacterized protein
MSKVHLAFSLAAIAALVAPAFARGDDDDRPTISVRGTGKVSAVPDIAVVSVGVRAEAPTAQKALADNNAAMNALHAILKERGVAAKDIQTSRIQVNPMYSQPPRRPNDPAAAEFVPRVVGYRVENDVRVTSRKIDKLGALLDALIEAGANQVHGISFDVGHPEKLLDEARRRAVADAKHKADLLAGEAGVVVGPPWSIREDEASAPPAPHFFRAGAMAAAPMPVAAGEQELSVTVHVVFGLKTPK